MSAKELLLKKLRRANWSVAIHNDYYPEGQQKTFWLFTHPSGVWAKGEGETDETALQKVWHQAIARGHPGLGTGVTTGDVVDGGDPVESGWPYRKAVVIGFLLTHPDTERVYVCLPGDGASKVKEWPPGGDLTAERIGLEIKGAREKLRNSLKSSFSQTLSTLGIE